MPGISLGPWAAKVFKDSGRDFVLVLEQRTYLTLLFPFAPLAQFRLHLSGALANALVDLGIPLAIARAGAGRRERASCLSQALAGAVIVTEISLIGWLSSASAGASAYTVALAWIGFSVLTFIALILRRLVVRYLKGIRSL